MIEKIFLQMVLGSLVEFSEEALLKILQALEKEIQSRIDSKNQSPQQNPNALDK